MRSDSNSQKLSILFIGWCEHEIICLHILNGINVLVAVAVSTIVTTINVSQWNVCITQVSLLWSRVVNLQNANGALPKLTLGWGHKLYNWSSLNIISTARSSAEVCKNMLKYNFHLDKSISLTIYRLSYHSFPIWVCTLVCKSWQNSSFMLFYVNVPTVCKVTFAFFGTQTKAWI